MKFKTWEAAVVAGRKAAENAWHENAAECFKEALQLMPEQHPMRVNIEDAYNDQLQSAEFKLARSWGFRG